jgi:metallophosphoesterase (TIGR03768 family)
MAGSERLVRGTGRPVPTYPIDPDVRTTVARTVVPDPAPAEKLLPCEVSRYGPIGYGTWHFGPGTPRELRTDLVPDEAGAARAALSRLVRFFTFTDIHITDEETPVQAVIFGMRGGASSGYSPVMMYTTQVLDAAVQTVNALHQEVPFDFGISLGDAANNTQYNELRWYIDVLDGHRITPASGLDAGEPDGDDVPDYQRPFQPAGLDPEIPWFQTMGNHDHLFIGTLPVNDYLRSFYEGSAILDLGNIFADKRGVDSRGFYTGSIDGTTPLGDIIGAGPVSAFPEPPHVRAADPARRSLRSHEWMQEFFTTTSGPEGHGFSGSNVEADEACYAFRPRQDVPLEVIVLDDTQRGTEADVGGYGHGYLDEPRLGWLFAQLERGRDENIAMVVAAHVPLGVEEVGTYVGWSTLAAISEPDLFARLHEFPNLVAWVAGHRHKNAVTPFPSPDPARPELGFWQIETSSLRDFPQQFRTFDVVLNDDESLSIIATDVDPSVSAGTPAARSRGYAVAAQQIFDNAVGMLPSGSSNVELLVRVPHEVAEGMVGTGVRLALA